MKRRRGKLEKGLYLAVFACLVWGFFIEPCLFLVETRAEVRPAGWPARLDGLRVAAISDIHAGSPYVTRARVRGLVARVNAAKPDLIVLLGDFVIQDVAGGRFIPPEDTAADLSALKAPLGVYAVLGNHDWYLDGPRVRAAFADRGIRVLENETVRLEKAGAVFRLLGLADYWERSPDAVAPLAKVPAGEPVVALVHEPDMFPEMPDRAALTLAGHTHGGQVRLPLLGSLVVPSRYGQRYARGVIVEGKKTMFVTTGVGTSIIPVRFGVPPEYAIVTVRAP